VVARLGRAISSNKYPGYEELIAKHDCLSAAVFTRAAKLEAGKRSWSAHQLGFGVHETV